MKDAIVAKVAAQAADYYQDAYRLATSPMVKSMWDKVFTFSFSLEALCIEKCQLGLS